MTSETIDLPDKWECRYSSDEESLTGTYQHKHLDVEVRVSKFDPADLGEEIDVEYIYTHVLQWGDRFGGVEAPLDPPSEVTKATEAVNWAIALMEQIPKQFEPGDVDYVSRAIRVTKGEKVSSSGASATARHDDAPACPICDAPFFQFRGFDTYEQAQNHLEFMDDEEHEGWDISLTEAE
ncbi:hypothetical protein RH858_02455 [Halalkaliarchaeum sp. AArc-GB]|uniref:hypothetical protein n=1 Tax=Halalkaliarchaeum sp. AArc-GB TaxID=3074078 RepID=UPI00285C6C2E|nr:hypothetical protein [Halalkaliarchaeum sp. AArc-GB]MDR5672018.1 hypothetical protein [Halalkaliarchaeum sp. AArc-GB]